MTPGAGHIAATNPKPRYETAQNSPRKSARPARPTPTPAKKSAPGLRSRHATAAPAPPSTNQPVISSYRLRVRDITTTGIIVAAHKAALIPARREWAARAQR